MTGLSAVLDKVASDRLDFTWSYTQAIDLQETRVLYTAAARQSGHGLVRFYPLRRCTHDKNRTEVGVFFCKSI